MPEQHLTPSEISDLTGATPQAINNWRNRYDDFPQPVDYSGRTPLFPRSATVDWLRANGKLLGDAGVRPTVNVRDVFAQFWKSSEDMARHDIVREVVLPALQGTAHRELAAAIEQVRGTQGGDAAADLVVELLSRVPGHVWRDFEVPSALRMLITAVADTPEGATTYDGCGGIGTLLAAATPPSGRAYLQEINPDAAELARVLMGLRERRVEVVAGDTIARDGHPGVRADRVVMAPPAGGRLDNIDIDDPRWEFGTPSRFSPADAWIMIALAHTAPDGIAVVHVPSSAIEPRPDDFFEQLVRQNLLDAVIELGPGQLAGSGTASCLIVLNRNRPTAVVQHTPILLVDLASDATGAQRQGLTPETVDTFVTSIWARWRHQPLAVEGLARTVTQPELRTAHFDLRPARHIHQLDWPRPSVNGHHPALDDLVDLTRRVSQQEQVAPRQLRPPSIRVDTAKPVTMRDLIRTHAVTLIQGTGAASRQTRGDVDEMTGTRAVVNVDDIPDNLLDRTEEPERPLHRQPTYRDRGPGRRMVQTGDVLVPMRWQSGTTPTIGVATSDLDDAMLGHRVAAIRLEPESTEILNGRYLRWWLATPRFQHFLATASSESSFGHRLPFKALHDFDFLLPPIQTQLAAVSELDEALSVIQQREAEHRAIADTYHDMYDLLLELFGAAHLTTQGAR